MLIKLHINTDNAAFQEDLGAEVARILRYAADRADNRMLQHNGLQLFDINGNCVGALYAEPSPSHDPYQDLAASGGIVDAP